MIDGEIDPTYSEVPESGQAMPSMGGQYGVKVAHSSRFDFAQSPRSSGDHQAIRIRIKCFQAALNTDLID